MYERPVVVPVPPVSHVELNDMWHIPALGFGVWQIENDKVGGAVRTAIEAGYRLIDTAQGYDNEAGVGKAINGVGRAARRAVPHHQAAHQVDGL